MWQKPDDGTFGNLQSKLVKNMQYEQHVNDKVLAVMAEAHKNALRNYNVLLSEPERAISFKAAMTQLLNELISEQN